MVAIPIKTKLTGKVRKIEVQDVGSTEEIIEVLMTRPIIPHLADHGILITMTTTTTFQNGKLFWMFFFKKYNFPKRDNQ